MPDADGGRDYDGAIVRRGFGDVVVNGDRLLTRLISCALIVGSSAEGGNPDALIEQNLLIPNRVSKETNGDFCVFENGREWHFRMIILQLSSPLGVRSEVETPI